MQTFDQALYKLYLANEISYDAALASADSANDLRLMIKLSGDDHARSKPLSTRGLSVESSDDGLGV
jgi:twitching motility protein PilU